MTSLSLHGIDDELSAALSSYADREKLSLNKAVKKLLASALGLTAAPKVSHLAELEAGAGALSEDEAARLRTALAPFETIDADLWK
ncbi:MAG: hypothetical protein IJT88_01900 [Kiritimatiellae bacterium]|nr:hypothetical protein [Kiritimatiellia bacterium]MBQ9343952.1 hypothetical protein [Kiritimatiellia bacterium]